MTQSARDLHCIPDIISGEDPLDSTSVPAKAETQFENNLKNMKDLRGVRVGIPSVSLLRAKHYESLISNKCFTMLASSYVFYLSFTEYPRAKHLLLQYLPLSTGIQRSRAIGRHPAVLEGRRELAEVTWR